MASRAAVHRPADEERFREFRARRLEKKEADRLKLTAEFPLLFNNKAVGDKVLNSSLNLNSKTPITPSGKRKSVVKSETNDENNAFAANKSASKPVLGAKTPFSPLSSKKPRKGSVLGLKSPIAQQKKVATVVVAPPALPATIVAASELSAAFENQSETTPEIAMQPTDVKENTSALEVKEVVNEVNVEMTAEAEEVRNAAPETSARTESPLVESVQSQAETVPQDIAESAAVVRKALFEDEELEHFTSTRSSLSSLGESIAGELFQSVDSNDQAGGSVHDSNGVQDQVLDVLDYLLELEEVDEVTHRRMSSQAFSIKSLKRLSMALPPAPKKSAEVEKDTEINLHADGEPAAEDKIEETENLEAAVEETDGVQNRRSSDVPMDLAYPESQEDCVIGELDVLNALRNYLAVVNREAEKKAAEAAVEAEVTVVEAPAMEVTEMTVAEEPIAETEDTILEFEEASEETAEITATSARSSASSVTTFDPRPQWTSTGRSSNGSIDTSNGDSQRSSMASSRSSLDSCCTTTMRVSFANAGAVANSQKRKSTEMSAASTEAPSTTNTTAAVTTSTVPAAKKSVTTHPLADLLDDALMRGLVVPSLTERIEMGNHTKYIVQTQILAVPGYPEENSRVRMMALKRYSDFKSLRTALLETMEAKRKADARASTSGKCTSMDSDDILSLARSRRSSVESCYRESLLNPRDSLGTDAVLLGQLGGFSRTGRESELLPPLPSRQIMSMTCASLQQEEDFQSTREAFLRTWIEAVFAKQSSESVEYRMELRKFLSA